MLTKSPGQVTIRFTEPLEPRLSAIEVLSSDGKQVDSGNSSVDAKDPFVMSVSLPDLPDGTYTVVWKSVSAADGHVVEGSYIFSVGIVTSARSAAVQVNQPLLQSPAEPYLNWLTLFSALVLVGGLAFESLVGRPVLFAGQACREMRRAGQELASRSSRLTWAAMGVFAAASFAQLINATIVANQGAYSQPLAALVATFLGFTRWGHFWFLRVMLLLALAAMFFVFQEFPPEGKNDARGNVAWWRLLLPFLLACSILFTLTAVSHASAVPGLTAEAATSEYLHLLAAAFWIGGLIHFALSFRIFTRSLSARTRRAVLGDITPRFSAVGILSVGTLVITGLYSSWLQVTVVRALATPYGLALLLKIGIIVPLLLIAAFNLLWVRPRLRSIENAGRHLRRLVTAEAVLAVIVLLPVGFLTGLEPARQVAGRQAASGQPPIFFHSTAENTHINLEIDPGSVGANRVTVSLENAFLDPITNANDVSVSFKHLDGDLGENIVHAKAISPGVYVADKALLSVAGPWRADLVVIRPDAFDTRASLSFQVSPPPSGPATDITPLPVTGKLLWWIELASLGALFLGVWGVNLYRQSIR